MAFTTYRYFGFVWLLVKSLLCSIFTHSHYSVCMEKFQTVVVIIAAITLFIHGLQNFSKEIESFGKDKLSRWINKVTQIPLGGFFSGSNSYGHYTVKHLGFFTDGYSGKFGYNYVKKQFIDTSGNQYRQYFHGVDC